MSTATARATVKPSIKAPVKPTLKAPEKVEPVTGTEAADPITELLASYKFDYTLSTIPLKNVDRAESKRNQARIAEPVNDDQVLLYAESMKAGANFPPIVVYKSGSTYIVMDGNHRVGAADIADIETLPAYVVKNPSPAEVMSYTFAANTKHGLPTSLADRIRQAIGLVDRHGVKAVDAAKQLGIPLNRLRSEMDNHLANARFRELGVKRFDSLPLAIRRRLDNVHSNRVLVAAAELVLEAGLTSDDTNRLVRQVNAKRSERESLDVIKAERDSRLALIKATAGGRIPVPQVLITLSRFSSGVANIEDKALRSAVNGLGPESRAEYARAAQDAGTRLIQLAGVIGQQEN